MNSKPPLSKFPSSVTESVTKFELKEKRNRRLDRASRRGLRHPAQLHISLLSPISSLPSSVARATYTSGYVLPGTSPGAGQTALPSDIEQAAIEQAAAWFQNRDKLGLIRNWPSGGTYQVFSQLPLLPNVTAVLKRYERHTL